MNSHTTRSEKPDIYRTPRLNKIEKIFIDDQKTLDKDTKVPVSNSYSFKSTIFSSSDSKNKQAATIDFDRLVEKIEKREKSHLTFLRNNDKAINEASRKASRIKVSLENKLSMNQIVPKSKFVKEKECTKSKLNLKLSEIFVKKRSQVSVDFPVINYKISIMNGKNVKKDILKDFIRRDKI
jgi:hypothetical protein